MKCLSSFARYPIFTRLIWELLDASQTIPTRAGPRSGNEGIRYELEEIESKYKTYPGSSAFTDFVYQLISKGGLPNESKIGSLNPYLQFFVDSVFLKANTREYK